MIAGRHEVLGLPVDALTMAEAVERVKVAIAERAPLQIITMNAEMAVRGLDDPALASVMRRAGLVTADGAGVVWALKRQGVATPKVAGVSLVHAIAAHAAHAGWRIGLFGAAPGVAQAAADELRRRYAGLRIGPVVNGYVEAETMPELLEAWRQDPPEVMLVALGVPRQELWIADHQATLGIPVAMGVGGTFDVLAGRVSRAPERWQKLQLEWLYRLVQEPWRFSRMRESLPRFVAAVFSGRRAPEKEETA